jgi:hypothetical protein
MDKTVDVVIPRHGIYDICKIGLERTTLNRALPILCVNPGLSIRELRPWQYDCFVVE